VSSTKLKLSLPILDYASNHENVWENGGTAPPFLISRQLYVEEGGQLYGPALQHGERASGSHWIGDCVETTQSGIKLRPSNVYSVSIIYRRHDD
jgi:hypothetical protein